jgi:hypothetical protein
MFRFRNLLLLGGLLSLGCLDTTGSNAITLNFDFTNPAQPIGDGWTSGVADVPADRVADVQVAGGFGNLPAPWAAYTGIEQGGTSINGSLFVFHKKWISSPWPPGRTFSIRLDMTFMSNVPNGCTGGPGSSVFLKAGVTGQEPLAAPDAQGVLRFNLDKGNANSGGHFVLFGNITNGTTGCPAESSWNYREAATTSQAETLTIDENGGFWIFIGTQSTFNGSHDIYLLGIRVILTPKP